MLLPITSSVAVALLATGVSSAAVLQARDIPTQPCTAGLLVDDFTSWTSGGINKLGGPTSDDGTLNSTDITGGTLTFTPKGKDSSYLFEAFDCVNAPVLGYDGFSFRIKGPQFASVSLELQTKTNCSSDAITRYYYTINALSGSLQTINVPFTNWTGANLGGITGLVWFGFSEGATNNDTTWQLDDFQLLCNGAAAPTSTSIPTSTATPTATPTPAGLLDARSEDSWDSEERKRQDERHAVQLRAAADIAEAKPRAAAACSLTVIDDWVSQSRLTFLYYNAMLKPTSDDGTMKSVVVANNKVTLTPSGTDSYFYSQLGCFDARDFGGISLRINAASGTTFSIQLSSALDSACSGDSTRDVTVTSKTLGWTFNGKEQVYSIPFSKFSGIDLSKFNTVLFSGFNKAVTLGPMALYCGTTVAEYVAPASTSPATPTATVAAPTSTASAFVIDTFGNPDTNTLGQWHGGDDGITLKYSSNKLTLSTTDADLTWQTQLSASCRDMRSFDGSYLHIAYTGSNKFTVALQQHNSACDESISPFPETWDSLEAARYATSTDIYIPMNHFNINRSRVIGVALKGFYSSTATVFSKIEIVKSVPSSFKVPVKLPSGTFAFACTRPNSFAFAIDDGDPTYAQEVLRVIEDAGFKATFFTVGAPLLDPSTNLSAVYREAAARGHQIALHSYTHPALEGLADTASIDWEYTNDLKAVSQVFGAAAANASARYFRAPFGTEGARMRQRYAALVPDPYIMQWSVDIEDWLWAETSTPEKQIDAFKRDVAAGGSLTVMHYLYASTVSYLPQFIQIAKASGKQLMRVDQCMQDPNAPPL